MTYWDGRYAETLVKDTGYQYICNHCNKRHGENITKINHVRELVFKLCERCNRKSLPNEMPDVVYRVKHEGVT